MFDGAQVESRVNSRGWDGLHWDGASVAILASGESLSVEQCDAVQEWRHGFVHGKDYGANGAPGMRGDDYNHRVIVINTTFRRAPWADVLYACDGEWWKCKDKGQTYLEEARQTFGLDQLWTQDVDAAKEYGLNLIKSQRGNGLSLTPGLITQNESSGFQAIGLAQQAGAKRALLLGFDNRGDHWHGKHPPPLNKINDYYRWGRNAKIIANDAARIGFEIVNCTPKSALECFPAKDWQEVFA